jgi:Do/DeqQ family serine protease
MKNFVKSFLGAMLGTALVFVIMFLTVKNRNEKNIGKSNNIVAQNTIPIVKSSYIPQKNVDFTEAAQKSVNAVVHIKTEIGVKTEAYDDFFGPFRDYFYGYPHQQSAIIAYGSGVVISPDGYIVTNNHVVEGADRITVTFNDKRKMEAKVIGTAPSTDLALIKVDAKDLPYLVYGNSDDLKVGEWVLAVGNPFNLTSTVTAGIVSAKARNINILGSRSSIESFIQTDAAVNRGNSGGALVNTKGELVGINAAIASHTGVYEGYSFAIPVNIVKKVVDDLMKYGEIQRAYLGVQIRDIDADFANQIGLPEMEGVYVAGVVDGSGASDAGIKEGDVIIKINNTPINTISELTGTVGQYSPGDVVNVVIHRDGKEKTFKVTLKNKNGTTTIVKVGDVFYNNDLNVSLRTAKSEDLENLGLNSGLTVVDVNDGILKRGGIVKGFIITKVNGVDVNNKEDLNNALAKSKNRVIRLKGVYPNGMRVSYEFML